MKTSVSHRIEVTTLGDLLLAAADRAPGSDALVFPVQQHPDNRRTWEQLFNNSRNKAKALMALGITPGDHVGLLMTNCIDYVECLYAASLAGAVAVPINSRYRTSELSYVVENADLKSVITSAFALEHVDYQELLCRCFPEIRDAGDPARLNLAAAPNLRSVVVLQSDIDGGFVNEKEFYGLSHSVSEKSFHDRRSRVSVRAPVLLVYTSGTTENPRGCILSHESLVRNGLAVSREKYELVAGDRFWDPLPLFHMSTILPLTACADAACAFYAMVNFDPGIALETIEKEKITFLFATFPTIMSELINHPAFTRTDTTSLRQMNNVADVETLKKYQAAIPHAALTSAYGLTECGGVASFGHAHEAEELRLTTSGRPFSGIETRIIDPDTGEAVATDGRGEILIRGYCVMDGYYRNEGATSHTIDNDGWLHTGDLGRINKDGYITYCGRIKDMLKVGGENVSALEVESHISQHPGVKLVQVVGVRDTRLQEVVAAFIETRAGHNITAEEIIAFCEGRIASYKVPRHVRFVTEWPMSSTKIQKFRLREMLRNNEAG